MSAKKIYNQATQKGIYFYTDCTSINITKHEKLMSNSTKANGKKIRKLIKENCPDLAESLGLNFPNPYEHKSRKKEGLLIYVHSAIEYFFKIN
jgi:hypothetical protein